MINKLLTWPSGSATRSVLDAAAESERIKTNLDSGKPINEGETPVIKESGKNFIKKLFSLVLFTLEFLAIFPTSQRLDIISIRQKK